MSVKDRVAVNLTKKEGSQMMKTLLAAHKAGWNALKSGLMGLLAVLIGCLGLWILFPGAQHVGVFVNRALGLGFCTDWSGPTTLLNWLLGTFILTGPFWLPRFGRFVWDVIGEYR